MDKLAPSGKPGKTPFKSKYDTTPTETGQGTANTIWAWMETTTKLDRQSGSVVRGLQQVAEDLGIR
jgi:hypothetical protein